jgi:hypothetical protein
MLGFTNYLLIMSMQNMVKGNKKIKHFYLNFFLNLPKMEGASPFLIRPPGGSTQRPIETARLWSFWVIRFNWEIEAARRQTDEEASQ